MKVEQGPRAVITGGADGIGRAIALAFVRMGGRVHICDLNPDAVAKLCGSHPAITGTIADVGNETDAERFFDDAIARLGGLDVLVNNAGIAGPAGPIETMDSAGWHRTFAINLDGPFYCIRRAAPALKQSRGSIINIASTAGIMGYPLRAPYAATKWAIVGITKSLAMELGPFGVRVNAICPGAVDGDRMQRVIDAEARARGTSPETIRTGYLRQSSLRCFVLAEDIAEMAAFLVSPAGAKINGQSLAVDGHTETLNND